ncbi:sporulation protein SpoIISA [Bacillus cereus]|uniref:type II toxin-antitoxin system SpoIISA family toxin n=1 Tax=Bacillus cereus TaxID=1396 RepID=UPI000BEC010A|nr:type II toxin-antitoxin system SpoIISA family toxin [Bacillus cereus]PDZ39780.1 sporulation protein SpoIISA [Bacillus cereus]PET44020.1 sporulation protein SpoIISA [Bacillus cereus]PFA14386.1 sporulation protein SpoIISA [Bacillus cereus]PFS81162.1 sporulation protein SpoIISA [Bacillus cereus]PGS17371.1 sporulation protein SpoIISA [Bacillus cereus]
MGIRIKNLENNIKKMIDSTLLRRVSPLLLFLLLWFIGGMWAKTLLHFVEKQKWFILIGFSGLIVYASWAFPTFFRKYKQNLRRTWYFLFIIGIVLLLQDTGFDTKNWQRYTFLAGMFIFVDLALFLTPMIKKIGGAEVELINEVESINEEMQKIVTKMQTRSSQFTGVLTKIGEDLIKKEMWINSEAYREGLSFFLRYYKNDGHTITVIRKEDEERFKQDIGTILGINLNKEQLEQLEQKNVVHLNNRTALIPYTEGNYHVVVHIISNKGPLIDIDIDHIVNLIVIHSWAKQKQLVRVETIHLEMPNSNAVQS